SGAAETGTTDHCADPPSGSVEATTLPEKSGMMHRLAEGHAIPVGSPKDAGRPCVRRAAPTPLESTRTSSSLLAHVLVSSTAAKKSSVAPVARSNSPKSL